MNVRIEKRWFFFGAPMVIYSCPGCEGELKSPVDDIGKEDTCPECDHTFEVPGETEYQAYMDSKEPKPTEPTPEPESAPSVPVPSKPQTRKKSRGKSVEDHRKNIAKLEKDKAVFLKKRRMYDYTNAVLDQANSYEQIAQNYDGDEMAAPHGPSSRPRSGLEHDKIVNANFLESTIKYIEYDYLLANGAFNSTQNDKPIWNKDLIDLHEGFSIGVLQPYSRMGGNLRELEGLYIKVTTQVQKQLKCPISPVSAWKLFAKDMKKEKERIERLF